MAKRTFPDRFSPAKRAKAVKGKLITVSGEAMSIGEAVNLHSTAFSSLVTQPIYFHPDLNEMTEDQFDMPDSSKFGQLDPIDQIQVAENLVNLQTHLNQLIENRKAEYNAVQNKEINNTATTEATSDESTVV